MTSSLVYALALTPAVLWGFEPVVSKRGMAAGGSSLQASLTVMAVDGAIYWAVLGVTRDGPLFGGVTGLGLAAFVAAGVVGTGVGRLATFAGVHRVGASLNSAGISTRPLFATLIALVWLGEPLGPMTAAGIAILVAGLVVLTLSKGGDLSGWRPVDLLFPLLAALAFALGNVIRRFGLTRTDVSVLQAITLNETAAAVALVAFVLAAGRTDVLRAPRETYRYFAASGLLTAVALLALFEAFDRGRVAVVDPLAGTAPLFTTVFAYFLLDDLERVTKGIVVGALMIVLGAALITV